MSPRPPAGKLTAYLDDGCALCVGTARRIARLDRRGRVRFRALADGAESFAPEDLQRELHVVDAEGTVFRGYDALVAIVSRVGALAWLSPDARLGADPPNRASRLSVRGAPAPHLSRQIASGPLRYSASDARTFARARCSSTR